jgi:hypothetical protein
MGEFEVADRVRLHPATDWWMRGATHGCVRKVGRKWIHVQLEVGGQLIRKTVKFRIGTDLLETVGGYR